MSAIWRFWHCKTASVFWFPPIIAGGDNERTHNPNVILSAEAKWSNLRQEAGQGNPLLPNPLSVPTKGSRCLTGPTIKLEKSCRRVRTNDTILHVRCGQQLRGPPRNQACANLLASSCPINAGIWRTREKHETWGFIWFWLRSVLGNSGTVEQRKRSKRVNLDL